MRAAGQTQRIALAAVFQIVRLAMHAVMPGGIGARAGIECEDTKAGFAEKLHGHAAASTGANHDRVEESYGHVPVSSIPRFSMLRWNGRRIAGDAHVRDRRDA